IETRKIRRLHNHAFLDLHGSGNNERHCGDLSRLLKFVNSSHDRVNNRIRVFSLRRVLFEPSVNTPLLIDGGGTEGRPTQISSENQFSIRIIRVSHTVPKRLSVSQHSSHAQYSSRGESTVPWTTTTAP